MCPGLTRSAAATLAEWASDELREVPAEARARHVDRHHGPDRGRHAGSDLAQVRTMAVPDGDGTWRVTGNKIFISWGNHDMSENTVHLGWPTPDAPAGTRGISLFAVPGPPGGPDGEAGEPNGVVCVSTEHKLGIKAAPPASFVRELPGRARRRASSGPEGHVHDDERVPDRRRAAGSGAFGARLPEGQGVRGGAQAGPAPRRRPVEDGPDRSPPGRAAHAHDHEGGDRGDAAPSLLHRTRVCDMAADLPDGPDKEAASRMEAFLTPIAKAWPTDTANEVASLGIQVHGGWGS